MNNPTSPTTVRLAPELIERLKGKAKEDDRRRNNIINRVLANFVKQADEAKPS